MCAMAAAAGGQDAIVVGMGVACFLLIAGMDDGAEGGAVAAQGDARPARHQANLAALRAYRSRTPIGPRWDLSSWTDEQALSLTRFTKVRASFSRP